MKERAIRTEGKKRERWLCLIHVWLDKHLSGEKSDMKTERMQEKGAKWKADVWGRRVGCHNRGVWMICWLKENTGFNSLHRSRLGVSHMPSQVAEEAGGRGGDKANMLNRFQNQKWHGPLVFPLLWNPLCSGIIKKRVSGRAQRRDVVELHCPVCVRDRDAPARYSTDTDSFFCIWMFLSALCAPWRVFLHNSRSFVRLRACVSACERGRERAHPRLRALAASLFSVSQWGD